MICNMTVLEACLYSMSLSSNKTPQTDNKEERSLEASLRNTTSMSYIAKMTYGFYIDSSGQAITDCYIYGYEEITLGMLVTVNLQKYKDGEWLNVKTFSKSSNTYRISLYEKVNIEKGYSYRILVQVKALSEAYIEIRNLKSNKVKY